MSDNLFVLVPSDPRLVPGESEAHEAVRIARQAFPTADSVSARSDPTVQFFDCGGNFEAVFCPHCGVQLPISVWQDLMSGDFREGGFILVQHEMPCCGATATLDDLRYDWLQAFGRFALEVMNPDVEEPAPDVIRSIEAALGCSLRVVCQHL